MKKITLTFGTILMISFFANAQTIPNNGFENWSISNGHEIPDSWSSTLFSPDDTNTVSKTTDNYSGSYAIKIETKNAIMPNYYYAGVASVNFYCNVRPSKLKFYYKYTPAADTAWNDSCMIGLNLKKWNGTTNHEDIIAYAFFNTGNTVSTYTYG